MDERIFFKLRIEIPEVDKFKPNTKEFSLEYNAELVFETGSNFFIKVYFDNKELLDRKIMDWDPKYSFSLLSKFKVTEIINPKRLLHIDFGNYYHKGITSSTDFYEFGKQYFTIKPEGIRLVYEAKEQFDSEIYLNDTAFNLIELNYRYQSNFPWNKDKFKLKPVNKIKEFIDFNNIKFIPEHNFFVTNKNSDKLVTVEKEPRFRIKHDNISELQIKEHVTTLCDLYSFYTNKKVDWKFARIYAEGKQFVEIRDTINEENKDFHGLFIWDFSQNPLNLIKNVNAGELVNNRKFVSKLIERFNYALKTSDETKFMVLYSLLEELRNHYILTGKLINNVTNKIPNSLKIKEEYKFIIGREKSVNFIKTALEKIIEIIDDSDKDLFKAQIFQKVPGIMHLSMNNQFESYFKSVDVEPKNYDLNFKELISLRNDIFHGKPIKDLDYLKKVNWYEHLPKLVGELLIKYFGIDNLKNIKDQRVLD
ncbi:MAG: hypothetical protein ACO1OF_10930 [Adhaeribacter sp.]